jgi:hypothetical protein
MIDYTVLMNRATLIINRTPVLSENGSPTNLGDFIRQTDDPIKRQILEILRLRLASAAVGGSLGAANTGANKAACHLIEAAFEEVGDVATNPTRTLHNELGAEVSRMKQIGSLGNEGR